MVCTRAALATWLYRAKKVNLIFHIKKAELHAYRPVLNVHNTKQAGIHLCKVLLRSSVEAIDRVF